MLRNLLRSKRRSSGTSVAGRAQIRERHTANLNSISSAPTASMVVLRETGPFRLRVPLRGDVTAVAPFLRDSNQLD